MYLCCSPLPLEVCALMDAGIWRSVTEKMGQFCVPLAKHMEVPFPVAHCVVTVSSRLCLSSKYLMGQKCYLSSLVTAI